MEEFCSAWTVSCLDTADDEDSENCLEQMEFPKYVFNYMQTCEKFVPEFIRKVLSAL